MKSLLLIRNVIMIAILAAIDFYVFQSFSIIVGQLVPESSRSWAFTGFMLINGGFLLFLFLRVASFIYLRPPAKTLSLIGALLTIFYLPKLGTILFLLVEDIFHFLANLYSNIVGSEQLLLEHSLEMALLGHGFSVILFGLILHGLTFGKYNYRVHREELHFADLPKAFDGMKIVQISDVHAGNLDNEKQVSRAMDMIMEEKPDMIVFTGDMVNNLAREAAPWVKIFQKLSAPLGMYSILGNHDYGDYVPWRSAEDRMANLRELDRIHEEMGFRLLKNEHAKVRRNGESMYVLGVENWGLPPFPQYGDLEKTDLGIPDNGFRILLSHDPSHWHSEVLTHDPPIYLTMSGHTHGFQMGIELPGFRWSPVQYKYPCWAGIYEEAGRYLYVNRGFGFLFFPGRIGIWPEITSITLKKV